MKRKYYVANISGGKDSMAMFLLICIKGYPIDEVVFFDTGWEFDCIYKNIKSVEYLCYLANIKFTVIKPDKSFDFLMFEHPHKTRKGKNVFGYSWCGGVCRWGTTQKTQCINKHFKQDEFYTWCSEYEREYITSKCTKCRYYSINKFDRCFECTCGGIKKLIRPPQSWCYVEE